MRSLALIAVIVGSCYCYYCRQPHPPLFGRHGIFSSAQAQKPAPAAPPVLHYHSPLDADNSQNSSGYFSAEPAGRYETSGPKSTASGRAALAQEQATKAARTAKSSPADEDEP